MPGPVIRPATQADLDAFYGYRHTMTMRAWVAVLDGRPIGVCGVGYPRGRPIYLFSDIKPEMRRFPKAILRGARLVLDAVKGPPLFASASSAGAARLLGHLGLRHVGNEGERMIFEWSGT